MITITMREIERDLLSFLQRVKAGEQLIILDADEPLAEVRPLASDTSELRPYALCAGEFEVPDDFDAPLPDGETRHLLSHPANAAHLRRSIDEA